MPATEYTQNKSPAISADLMASAKSGCTDALNELWVMLMPVARNAAMHHCVKFVGMRGSVDDIAQELLCHVPRLVEKFPEEGREDILGWFRFCLRRECLNIILNHPGYVRARNNVNILPRIVQPEDFDESEDAFNYETLPAEVECAICRKPFCPGHAEHIICSEKCGKIRDNRRHVVSAAFSECIKILDRLQSGAITSMEEFPDINCRKRVAQLRAIGYRIKLSGGCTSMQLEGTPFAPTRLGERLALLLYGGAAAVASCEICGEDYEFTPNNPRITCEKNGCRNFVRDRLKQATIAHDDCKRILDRLRGEADVGFEEFPGIKCLGVAKQLLSVLLL